MLAVQNGHEMTVDMASKSSGIARLAMQLATATSLSHTSIGVQDPKLQKKKKKKKEKRSKGGLNSRPCD